MTFATHARRFHQLMAARFSRKSARRISPGAMVSFTFDDFPRSAFTIGGRMLVNHGWRGTFYGAMGLMGSVNDGLPMFTRADLDDLLLAGHELACHTSDHTSCLTVPTNRFVQSCRDNRNIAASMLGGYRLRNLSFPAGQVSLSAKRSLGSDYASCRSNDWGINDDLVDLAYLRANPLYSRKPLEQVRVLIDRNTAKIGWLIFYTHDISENPSLYGCTPEYFEEVIKFTRESGANVVTIDEALTHFEPCGTNGQKKK